MSTTGAKTAKRLPGCFDDYAIKQNSRLVGILIGPAPGIDDRWCYTTDDGERSFFADRDTALAGIGIGSADAVAA